MKFIVRRSTQIVGILSFEGTMHRFEGDAAVQIEIADMVRAGKPSISDPLFTYALLDELRARSYSLEEVLSEVEVDFGRYMALIPKDTALYRDTMQQWALMSLLEKTYLLDILQKDKILTSL